MATIQSLWREILGKAPQGVDADFVRLDGDLFQAATLAGRLRQVLGVDVPVGAVLDMSTIRQQAAWLTEPRPRLRRSLARQQQRRPLSFAQSEMWMLANLAPPSAFNVQWSFRLVGPLDHDLLARSLAEVSRRHDSLRTSFGSERGAPYQVVDRAGRVDHAEQDLRRVADNRAEAARRAVVEAERPFDLRRPPLWRTRLLRLGDEEHVLILTVHHLVSDNASMQVWWQEVVECQAALREGCQPELPALSIQPADLAIWERKRLQTRKLERHRDHWRRRLAGAAPVDLPTDRPRRHGTSYATGHVLFELCETEQLRAFAAEARCTPFTVLLALVHVLVMRLSGEEDVVVGTPATLRTRPELRRQLGLLLTTVPLRADLSGNPSFRELLDRMRGVWGDLAFRGLPFELMVGDQAQGAPTGLALRVMATMVADDPLPALPDVTVETSWTKLESLPVELSFVFRGGRDRMSLRLAYAENLFDRSTIDHWARGFRGLLAAALSAPERRLWELPVLDEPGRALIADTNRSQLEVSTAPFHELVAAQADRTPDAVAVEHGDHRLTYRELDRCANRIAHALRERGVAPGARVGVSVSRSPELVAALLGVLKSGAAYVALDPNQTPESAEATLREAQVALTVVDAAGASRLPANLGQTLRLDADAALIDRQPDTPAQVAVDGEDLAYLIYTSGSTGRPKGVMVPHRAVVNRLASMQHGYPHGPDEITCAKTSLTFVDSMLELLCPLAVGCRCVLPDDEVVTDPVRLARFLDQHGVTRVLLVPSLLRTLLLLDDHGRGGLKRLRLWVVSGEEVTADLVEAFFARFPDARLVNLYGSSEVNGDATWHELTPGSAAGRRVPIGRPIANTDLYVVDRRGGLAPIGVWGELLVGGRNLACGYLHRPDLTSERFVHSPLAPGHTLFRTGDRVRYRSDGVLEFGGRRDDRIKVRGLWVSPVELEQALTRHPGVGAAAVAGRPGPDGTQRLVAYVTPRDESTPSSRELREHLRTLLPEAMLPSLIVDLPALPTLPSGKVDRASLPDPPARPVDAAARPPQTTTERIVAEVWEDLLGSGPVGRDDDFFAVGGHSLLAAQLGARLGDRLGMEVPLPVLFDVPTVAGQAAWIDRARGGGGAAPADAVPTPRRGAREVALRVAWAVVPLAALAAAVYVAGREGFHYSVAYGADLRGPMILFGFLAASAVLVHALAPRWWWPAALASSAAYPVALGRPAIVLFGFVAVVCLLARVPIKLRYQLAFAAMAWAVLPIVRSRVPLADQMQLMPLAVLWTGLAYAAIYLLVERSRGTLQTSSLGADVFYLVAIPRLIEPFFQPISPSLIRNSVYPRFGAREAVRALVLGLYAIGLAVAGAKLMRWHLDDAPMALRIVVDFAVLYCFFPIQIFLAVTMFRVLGFDLPSGFRYPLLSRSFADFFRRWNHYVRDAVLSLFYLPMIQWLRKRVTDRAAHLLAGYAAILIGSFILNDLFVPVATSHQPWSALREQFVDFPKLLWLLLFWTGVVWPATGLTAPGGSGERDWKRSAFEVARFLVISAAIWTACEALRYSSLLR